MDKNLNIVANYIDNATPGLQDLGDMLNELGKGLVVGAVAAAVGLLVDKFVEATAAAINFGDSINDLAERSGIATEELSAMAYAAELNGTTFEAVTASFRKLGKAMEEARDPASDMGQLFEQMGISVLDAEGKLKNADVMMGELADQFKDMPNGIEKANLAIAIFGKSGADLIPMLNKGSAGLAEMKKEAEGFGLIWTPEQTAAAGDFNDNIDRVKKAVEGMFTQIAQYLLPALVKMSEALVGAAKEGGVLKGVFDAIKGAVFLLTEGVFKPFAIVVYSITAAFGMMGKAIGGAAAALVAFLGGDFAGAKNIIAAMGDDVIKTGEDIIKFSKNMYGVGDAADQAGAAGDKAVPKLKKLGDEAKKTAEEISKYLDKLTKERDSVGATAEQKDVLELEEKILDLKRKGASVKQIDDFQDKALRLIAEKNARQENWDAMQKQLDAEIKLAEVRKTVTGATDDIKFENSIMHLSNEERKIAIELRKLEKSLIGASKEEIEQLTAARRQELLIQQEQNKLEGLLAQTQTKKVEESQKNMLALTKAFESGKISEQLYLEGVQVEMERMGQKAKTTANEMTEFFKEAAKNIQGAMSDFLFDFMQGKMSDLGASMKNMIDRMVANFLAAKAATALFGSDFGKADGAIGGIVGDLFSGIAGARAGGGPVEAGKTYIVGEKRPELFTPSSNGFISPDTSALQGGMGSVAISISALDGADVMRVLEGRKKEIAHLVTATNRTYNLRG